MKTNYMNPKQQIFAVALTVATLVSLAWANPRDKKSIQTEETYTVEQVQETSRPSGIPEVIVPIQRALKIIPVRLPIDTPKKKKSVKIITVDENGKRTEYKSVKELPDSIKAELQEPDFFVENFRKHFADTANLLALRKNAEALAMKFNNPEERARLKKLGQEMAERGELLRKKFDSPEQRAKLEKLSLEMRKQGELFREKMNSPEERARMEKLGIEMRRQGELFREKMNSPEERAKWKKLETEMKKHTQDMMKHTTEQQKEIQKLQEGLQLKAKEMQELIYTPDIAVSVEKLAGAVREVE